MDEPSDIGPEDSVSETGSNSSERLKSYNRRVKVRLNGQIGGGKWIALKAKTFEELLAELSKSFNVKAGKLFDSEGTLYEDLDSIRDGDLIYVAEADATFIEVGHSNSSMNLTVARPPISGDWSIVHPNPRVVSQLSGEDYTETIFNGIKEVLTVLSDNEGWVKTSSQLDCVGAFKRKKGDPFCTFRGIGEIKAPIEVAESRYRELVTGVKTEDFLKDIKIMEELSEKVLIVHRLYQTRVCLSKFAHDTAMLVAFAKCTDGTQLALLLPCNSHPSVKDIKDSTRFSIKPTGILLQPKLGNPKHTIVTYLSQVDVSEFPETIFNIVAKKFPLGARTVARIRKTVTGSSTNDTPTSSHFALVRKELKQAVGLQRPKLIFSLKSSGDHKRGTLQPNSVNPVSPPNSPPPSQHSTSVPSEHYSSVDPVAENVEGSDELISEKMIGSGNFGNVYKGKWKGITCAIKILKPEHQNKSMESFEAEAAVMMNLIPHPNVVTFYALLRDPFCLLTEYCANGSLYTYLFTKERLDRASILKIVKGIPQGMAHLHAANIIHRDLACRNILLDDQLEPKISDFGLSRILDSQFAVGVTGSNTGPIRHMSPESLLDRAYSTKSDVWSFGVTLFEILQREVPYKENTPTQVATLVSAGKLKLRLSPKNENEWTECKVLMENCLNYKPESRPSFLEIIEFLNVAFP